MLPHCPTPLIQCFVLVQLLKRFIHCLKQICTNSADTLWIVKSNYFIGICWYLCIESVFDWHLVLTDSLYNFFFIWANKYISGLKKPEEYLPEGQQGILKCCEPWCCVITCPLHTHTHTHTHTTHTPHTLHLCFLLIIIIINYNTLYNSQVNFRTTS